MMQRAPEEEQKGNSLEINLCCGEAARFKRCFCFSSLKWSSDQKQEVPKVHRPRCRQRWACRCWGVPEDWGLCKALHLHHTEEHKEATFSSWAPLSCPQKPPQMDMGDGERDGERDAQRLVHGHECLASLSPGWG